MPTIVFTGQHASLEPFEFGLDAFPSISLRCPGQRDPNLHVREVTAALLPLLRDAPDLVVVQGDTSSALGGALAAFTAGVPVAHVEAGLRTHDPMLPWPEEEYRCAIDADAQILFAPTELSAANLRAEKVPGEIYVTGNTGIDALMEAAARLPSPKLREGGMPSVVVTCHRRESWQGGLKSIAEALRKIANTGMASVEFVLHPNPYVARNMRDLLGGIRGLNLLDPCGHDELLQRMRGATMVLSDSGGIQEEAPALGVPLLVLRSKTERPEGVSGGSTLLVGTDPDRIVAEVSRLLSDPVTLSRMSCPTFPFGDGRAAPRIAEVVMHWLERRTLTRQLA